MCVFRFKPLVLALCSLALLTSCSARTEEEIAMEPEQLPVQEETSSASSEDPGYNKVEDPWTLSVSMVRKATVDANGEPHTLASVRLRGATDKDIVVYNAPGDFQFVDPSTYRTPGAIALFSVWWDGTGNEVMLRLDRVTHNLLIERRTGGEESERCSPWSLIDEVPVPPGVDLKLLSMGESTDESVLQYCNVQ